MTVEFGLFNAISILFMSRCVSSCTIINNFGYFEMGRAQRLETHSFPFGSGHFSSLQCIGAEMPMGECTSPLFILLTTQFAQLVVCTGHVDVTGAGAIGFRYRHRSRAAEFTLIVFGATPEYALFTFTISHVTVVVQYENGVAARWCLIRKVHITHTCSPDAIRKNWERTNGKTTN